MYKSNNYIDLKVSLLEHFLNFNYQFVLETVNLLYGSGGWWDIRVGHAKT